MDFFKTHLARLQQQFNQLSASQKMLTVSLMAIMIMTLLWWGRYAGQPEMEAVLDQDFAPEDVARITADLRSRGIPYSTSGSHILVPSDRKVEVLGSMIYQGMMPHDSVTPLLDLMNKSSSAFDSSAKTDMIANEGKQAYLAMIIRTFPQVRHAMVALAVPQHPRFGENTSPSATVYINMKPGEVPSNRLATAAADVIAGAISGMNRSNVRVIVDGVARSVTPDADEGGGGGNYMDQVRDEEKYYADQISNQFAFCEGVMVHVNVLPKTDTTDSKETLIDPKKVITKELENEHDQQSAAGANHAGGDPGVASNTGSNTGMAVGGGGASDGSGGTSTEKEHTKNTVIIPQTETTKHTPAGSCTVQSASIAFPRSYFVKAYKVETQSDKEPSEVLLQPYINKQLDKFKAIVKGCVHVDDPQIVVDTYTELASANPEPPTQVSSGVTMMLGNHVREIALGVLALMSLVLVPMIARKSGSAAMLAGAASGPGQIGGLLDGAAPGTTVDAILAKAVGKTSDTTAEVGEGGRTLDAVELDDETLRSQQVVEQVSSLVKDNPDAAANLIKRWMSRV
jgi:flagellar biosynthesis/type III secretory pathway M-ring protein FliF/YscJ